MLGVHRASRYCRQVLPLGNAGGHCEEDRKTECSSIMILVSHRADSGGMGIGERRVQHTMALSLHQWATQYWAWTLDEATFEQSHVHAGC